MRKEFIILILVMWGVLFTHTLCTLCCLDAIRNEVLTVEADIQEVRDSIDHLDDKISNLTSEIDELKSEIAELDAQIVEMRTQIEQLQTNPEPELSLTIEEINLIALVTMAEAEAEPEEGQRLVIDTILNRVDSEYSYWPDTVSGVIYQPAQFSSMWNGRVDRCRVTDEMVQLVKEELQSRTNTEVVYFRMHNYGPYGTPMFQVGNHYFSSL